MSGSSLLLATALLLPQAPAFSSAVRRVSQTGEPLAEREMPLDPDNQNAEGGAVAHCLLTPMSDADTPCGVLVELVQIDRLRRISRELAEFDPHATAAGVPDQAVPDAPGSATEAGDMLG